MYDRSYSYNSHNFRRSSYFAFIFLEGKSQSDNLLYREYIADAKPKIPGITVFVQYEDTIPVENLWRICYTLENTGNRNIIGEGAQSSLVAKGADFHYIRKNVKKMIQLSATDNNMVELRDNMLHFKQWLPDECITIEALVESSGENLELYIDEHDIINSKVIFKNSTNR